MPRLKAIFVGHVQGVWFRAFTRSTAEEHGLTGWVRNLPNGQVEALFEGDIEKIRSTVERCRMGPPAARVEKVEETWEEYATNEFGSFEIRQ